MRNEVFILSSARPNKKLSAANSLIWRTELRDYESLQRGEYPVDELKAIDELPSALIKARISLGLSQKDLANRLGLKEQQIQRYEATDYASASLTRIKEVVEALNQDPANPSPE